MRAEEYQMQDLDFTRWIPATYTWRLDEALQFRDIMNNSELARRKRMVFYLAPDPLLAEVMQRLPYSETNVLDSVREKLVWYERLCADDLHLTVAIQRAIGLGRLDTKQGGWQGGPDGVRALRWDTLDVT